MTDNDNNAAMSDGVQPGFVVKKPGFLVIRDAERAAAAQAAAQASVPVIEQVAAQAVQVAPAVAKAAAVKPATASAAAGADLMYAPGDDVFALAGPMMLKHGWSVVPQERKGRWTSRVDGKSVLWTAFQTRLPDADEMTAFCRDAPQANVAVAMGEASGKTFCVDIDCMDPVVSARVQEMALEHLGPTPFVRVGRAPKTALFYRYADQSPRISATKLVEEDDCLVEIKSAGSLMTMYGVHRVTGRYYHWPDLNPLSNGPGVLPVVTVEQADAFLDAVRREYATAGSGKGSASAAGTLFNGEVDADGLTVPVVALDVKLTDFREKYLKDLTWNLVWRNQEAIKAAGDQDAIAVRLTELAQKLFMDNCEMDGTWTAHHLRTQAGSKLAGALAKMANGSMKAYAAVKPKREPEASPHAGQVAALAALAGKVVIRVVDGDMSAVVDQAEASISHAGIFQRGGALVRMGHLPVATSAGIIRSRSILELGEHSMAEVLGQAGTYLRRDGRKGGDAMAVVEPPMSLVKTLLSRQGFWKLPVLAAAITAPTLRADGSLLSEEGHDAATGLLLESGGVQWSIPSAPTRDEAAAALGVIKELVATFPFVSGTDRSVVLSMLLTASVRRSLPAAPLHAISARAAGSGKSKLADIASVIASGRPASVVAMGRTEEETEKRLGALLLTGDAVAALDNLEVPLAGDFLCQMLTQPMVRTRVLGRSEVPELPTAVLVTATGNNLRVEGDMTRRTLLCMLDADCERPELRVFATDPVAKAIAGRQEYVSACLTVLRGYVAAGRPRQAAPLGSFEVWSGMVRDALLWLGEPDPVASMETVRASDPKRERAEAVLTQWLAVLGTGKVSAKDAIAGAALKGHDFEFKNPEFREALLQVAGEGGAVNSRALGVWLGKTEGRTLAGMKLLKGKLANGIQQWSVCRGEAAGA